jgi:hypothetical protein
MYVFGCSRYPRLRVGPFRFVNGLLEVETEEDAKIVMNADDWYAGHIKQLESSEDHVAPRETTVARQGMRGTVPTEKQSEGLPEASEPVFPAAPPVWPKESSESVDPEEVFGEEPTVLVKPGGWYEYEGKSYRKADLPADIQKLV